MKLPEALDAVLLMGPTGVGKSALALRLADTWPVEIVSVDSALVYRGMDIGTAKPTPAQRATVRHHLIDICDPAEPYSAGRFRRDAIATIAEVRSRGHLPLLVGGTMLYFRALTHGLAPLPVADPALRRDIEARAAELGWPALHAELAGIDAEAAARIRAQDGQRIQRALEVHALTGRTLSSLQREAPGNSLRLRAFALWPFERSELYRRLDARFDAMMERGLLEELRRLRGRGDLSPELPSLRAVGYRQLWRHLEGECSLDEAVEQARRATRQLAKRQLTWLRSTDSLHWINALEDQELMPLSRALSASAGNGGARSV